MKKAIAILFFVALLFSTSSLSYLYWLQEKLHEADRFAKIDKGEALEKDKHNSTITITLLDKSVLPNGYRWQEQGREFSYKGMFYDIVSITKTSAGWVIQAESDEEEAVIVSNQNKLNHTYRESESNNKKSTKLKFNISLAVYDIPLLRKTTLDFISSKKNTYPMYSITILNAYLAKVLQPPESV